MDWRSIAVDGPSIAVAATTLVLAIFTWRAAVAAKRSADYTQQAVEAESKQASAQAETLRHMVRQQEILSRPYLALQRPLPATVYVPDPDQPSGHARSALAPCRIRNVGRGPAVNCWCGHVDGGATGWHRSQLFHVEPGGVVEVQLEQGAYSDLPGPLFQNAGWNSAFEHWMVTCHDELGDKLYLFTPARPGFTVWYPTESQPAWVVELLQLHPELTPSEPKDRPGADLPGTG